jgi:hypothetical protein
VDSSNELRTSLGEMRNTKESLAEWLPFRKSRFESRECLNAKFEQPRVRWAVQSVNNVSDGNAERNIVDELVLDQRAEEMSSHSELRGWVGRLEELVFVKEEVKHAGKDFVVACVGRCHCVLQQGDDLVNARVFVVHLLVNVIHSVSISAG